MFYKPFTPRTREINPNKYNRDWGIWTLRDELYRIWHLLIMTHNTVFSDDLGNFLNSTDWN